MKRVNKLRKLQSIGKCQKHPNITQSIGKGGKLVCRQCLSDTQHKRDIERGKIQTTYSKSKEILTPMGNKSK